MSRTRSWRRQQRERVVAARTVDAVRSLSSVLETRGQWLVPGRWAKRHPFDCGKPRCGVCRNLDRAEAKLRRQEPVGAEA